MDKFIVEGGAKLSGTVVISGAKNAALAMIPTVLLAPGVYRFHNTPNIRDIWTMTRLLGGMGIHSELHKNELFVDASTVTSQEAPYEFVKKMRASINVLGPLVARYGYAKVSLPGGCAFGPRPVDLHLKGLEKLGAQIEIESGYIIAKAPNGLRGSMVHFDISSVGATENILSAAVLARGVTVLSNAAMEPEVTALAKMLVKMGAKINGIGTTTLEIEGVDALRPVEEEIIPDRIESATFLIAAAMTRGKVRLENINPYHITAVIAKLEESGCDIDVAGNTATISTPGELRPVDITTSPYPGFPTDAQAQWIAYMMTVDGHSKVTDTVYPTRFHHVAEYQRLGGKIDMSENTAIIQGGYALSGATVMSSDLRASAGLILAALTAKGNTEILRVYHIDRGYEFIENKIRSLNGSVQRVKTDEF